MNNITSTYNDALALARQGQLDVWIEQCLVSLRWMAYSFSQSSGIDAEDLLQEVALKLFRKSEKVLALPNPMGYVKVLARNTMIDEYRKVARRRRKLWLVGLERSVPGC